MNPLPVTLARSLGAEVILAVNVAGDLAPGGPAVLETGAGPPARTRSTWLSRLAHGMADAEVLERAGDAAMPRPSYAEVVGDSLFVVRTYVSHIRAAVDPPDVLITPDLSGIAVMDFHKGAAAMARGVRAVREVEPRIRALVG